MSRSIKQQLENSPYHFQDDFVSIRFQNGMPPDVGINGVRVEDVIDVLVARLEIFQSGRLACKENQHAITDLMRARDTLILRRKRRQAQGVYHTDSPHLDRTEDVIQEFSATGA
jgi:hypothetical protein